MKRLAWLALAILVAAPAAAQEGQDRERYLELLRSDIRADKVAIVTDVMALNDDQSSKFWPIYREYQAELAELTDARIANIKAYAEAYGSVTDEQADRLITKAMEIQGQRLDLTKHYYDKVKEALGPTVAARFVQAETFLNTLIDAKIQSELPIIE